MSTQLVSVKRSISVLVMLSTFPTLSVSQNEILDHPGRLLASNCFQCHGTNGKSVNDIDSLQGEDDIYEEMREMQIEPVNRDIMNVHARGYSDNEILLIAEFFASLPESDDDDHDDHDDDNDDHDDHDDDDREDH